MSVRTGVDEYNQPTSDINSGYIGEFKYFGFSDVPPHCLACDGSEISRTTYNELFTVFGETFGAGDGATTFNLPDLRGAFLRCIGGNAAELGTEQGDAIRDFSGTFNIRGGPNSGTNMDPGQTTGFVHTEQITRTTLGSITLWESQNNPTSVVATLSASFVVPTAAENRPINYAVNICVVYE